MNILEGAAQTYLPPVSLAAGKNGVVFGTTPMGGATNRGTVFSLTPPVTAGKPWSHTIVHNFSGSTDGSEPTGGVAVGVGGILYGFNHDTVYRVEPPSKPGGDWSESLIYRFGLTAGAKPGFGVQGTPLLIGKSIYGVTTSCSYGATVATCGAVFRLDPPSVSNGPWELSTIWSFHYPANTVALAPTGFLIAGPKGKLYGTLFGGFEVKAGIFELTPPSSAGKPWMYNIIYSFPTKKPDGSQLAGPIAIGRFGEIYGTTENGGASGLGEIFKLSPPASAGGRWTKTASDAPFAALGAPAAGGAVLSSNGGLYSFVQSGAVIQITPTSGGAWPSTIVHQFQGGKDGATPLTLVAFPGSPDLYGLTENAGSAGADPTGAGGSFGWGTVFQLKP